MTNWTLLLLTILALTSNTRQASIQTCDSDATGYIQLFSKSYGQLTPNKEIKFPGKCFKEITVSLSETATQFTFEIKTEAHKSLTCIEFLIFSTGKSSKTMFIVLDGKYHKSFEKENLSEGEHKHIHKKGFFVMRSCDDFKNIFGNIFSLLKMFLGGQGLNPYIPIFGSKILEYQLKANIDFTKKFIGYEWQLRQNPKKVLLDKKSVKSGDFVAITRFDGLDNLIHWGTGSRAGHTAMALWKDNELYVLESQNALYWPANDIQRRNWDSWVKWADNADYNVVVIPLNDEQRAKFDEKKAWEAFEKLEGHPYGFSNFLFGYIDTENENYQDVLDIAFISIAVGLLEKVLPDQMKLVFYDAWNQRLGTKGLNMGGIWEELYKRDMTLNQVAAMVEVEGWDYPTGPNYVCSSFVVHLYKAAGLFDSLEINATEFTPKDLYELAFFDISGAKVPVECQNSAPHGYCQIMGKVDMDLGKMNWVKPYNNMAEKCPSIAPDYERSEGC